jgi:hypothetical protein
MRLEEINVAAWSKRGSWSTEPGEYVGVAIGPESDEGRVYIDGHLLQAGRVLALRAHGSSYAVTRAVGPASGFVLEDGNNDPTALGAVKRCQLMLFECAGELAAEVARPNGEYNTTRLSGDVTSTDVDNSAAARILVAPFTGRREMRVYIKRSGPEAGGAALGLWGYTVIGRRWSESQQAVIETTLEDVTALDDDEVTTYLGGTNEAEAWDEIAVDVHTEPEDAAPATAQFTADITTVGEIGAR